MPSRPAPIHNVAPALHEQLAPIEQALPYPGNPRRGNVAVIADSLTAHGQYRPLVLQASTGHVLVGNHTRTAMLQLGWTHCAQTRLNVDDTQAARIVAMDNRTSDLAGYDTAQLLQLLQDLPDLAHTGWEPTDLADLLASVDGHRRRDTDPDDAPPTRPDPACQPGQLWHLGPHRLLVGDSTDPRSLTRLLDGEPVDLLLTDPPYGVSYSGRGMTIRNDELRDQALADLLEAAFRAAAAVLRPGAAFYVFGPSHEQQTAFRSALSAAGLRLRSELVWVKNSLVLGRSDYQPRHESILHGDQPATEPLEHDVALYGWADGAPHTWRGGRRQSTVWEFPKPARCDVHPTMKPVAMLEQAITNSTPGLGIVLDQFAGSGSTLIACYGTERIARLVELDPVYADVICRRWQEHSGIVPVLDGQGPRSFVEAA